MAVQASTLQKRSKKGFKFRFCEIFKKQKNYGNYSSFEILCNLSYLLVYCAALIAVHVLLNLCAGLVKVGFAVFTAAFRNFPAQLVLLLCVVLTRCLPALLNQYLIKILQRWRRTVVGPLGRNVVLENDTLSNQLIWSFWTSFKQ